MIGSTETDKGLRNRFFLCAINGLLVFRLIIGSYSQI